MEIKEALENYNNYIVRIAVIDRELFKLRHEEVSVNSINLNAMPKTKGLPMSNIENKIIDKITKVEELETERQQLVLEITIIDKLILTLKKNTQDIVNMRYKDKVTIEYIADKKDRTYRAITSILSKAISDMEVAYNRNL